MPLSYNRRVMVILPANNYTLKGSVGYNPFDYLFHLPHERALILVTIMIWNSVSISVQKKFTCI